MDCLGAVGVTGMKVTAGVVVLIVVGVVGLNRLYAEGL